MLSTSSIDTPEKAIFSRVDIKLLELPSMDLAQSFRDDSKINRKTKRKVPNFPGRSMLRDMVTRALLSAAHCFVNWRSLSCKFSRAASILLLSLDNILERICTSSSAVLAPRPKLGRRRLEEKC